MASDITPSIVEKVEESQSRSELHALPGTSGSTIGAPLEMPAISMPQADEQSKRRRAELVRKRNLLILGIVLTVPVVILSMFFRSRDSSWPLQVMASTTRLRRFRASA